MLTWIHKTFKKAMADVEDVVESLITEEEGVDAGTISKIGKMEETRLRKIGRMEETCRELCASDATKLVPKPIISPIDSSSKKDDESTRN